MPENTRGIQTHTASLHLCQCDQMTSIAHCMGCWIRIKSFLGCHWGGGRSPSDTINLVVRLDATADKQLNPFLPECLCHTAVMFNDKAACCFQRPCMIVTKGGLKDVVFFPLMASNISLCAVSLLSQKIQAALWILPWFKLLLTAHWICLLCSFTQTGHLCVKRGRRAQRKELVRNVHKDVQRTSPVFQSGFCQRGKVCVLQGNLTLILLIAATISIRLPGRPTSKLPMYCKT